MDGSSTMVKPHRLPRITIDGFPDNPAELAQKVAGIIAAGKTKTQAYCQIDDLSDELDQADQQKERKKAEDLYQKINELQKTLGPEYLALREATKDVDPNSKEGQEVVSSRLLRTRPRKSSSVSPGARSHAWPSHSARLE
jgi:hypothetical protein